MRFARGIQWPDPAAIGRHLLWDVRELGQLRPRARHLGAGRAQAEDLIDRQRALSEETGNPAVLHLYARTPEAFDRYLDFIEGAFARSAVHVQNGLVEEFLGPDPESRRRNE